MPGLREHHARLVKLRDTARSRRQALIDRAERENRDSLTADESRAFERLNDDIKELDEAVGEASAELRRAGLDDEATARIRQASGIPGQGQAGDSRAWAATAAKAVRSIGGETGLATRALTSGNVDVPTILPLGVTPGARPERLIDLLVTRLRLESNSFEWFRQSLRTNNAAPVADSALKPTSVFTMEAVQDRARVVAHLSEPTPQRLLMDVPGLEQWLWSEMAEGVLDALEAQVIAGEGTGESFTGVLASAGTTPVAYSADVPTTLRKALTAAQVAGDKPTAAVISPATAELLDLSRWGSEGDYLLPDALTGTPGGNIFGPASIARIVSPSVPDDVAIVADWSKIVLAIRENLRIDIDLSGTHFQHNTFQVRAEMRVGVAVSRPSSFYVCSLTE